MIHNLTLEQVLRLHERTILEHGGGTGIRDTGILDSAINQPRMSYGGADLYVSLEEKASALGYSLINNHPFVDGNKRTGMAAMNAFLEMNGYSLVVEPDEGEFFILCVADGEASRDELTQWIRDHAESIA